jgi:hypothetical protein
MATHGRLGIGVSKYNTTTPMQVVSPSGTVALTGVAAVSSGDAHALALGQDGSV